MVKKRSTDTKIFKDIKSIAANSFDDNIKMIPIEKLYSNSKSFCDISDLDILIEDIELYGLKTPLNVVRNGGGYTIIDGHRRKAAVQELINRGKYGTDMIPCYVGAYINVKKNEAETLIEILMKNAKTRVSSDAETVKAYTKLKKAFSQLESDGKNIHGRMRDKIAVVLNISPAQVGKIEYIQHHAIDKIKTAVYNGNMTICTANMIAKLSSEQQQALIEQKKPEEITHKEVKELFK